MHRFHIPSEQLGAVVELAEFDLPAQEAAHAARVLRLGSGDELEVFDGSGNAYRCRIIQADRRRVTCRVEERRFQPAVGSVPLIMAVAMPKGERQRSVIEKASEFGVHRLIPLVTARGVAQILPGAIERLRRQSIESAKQCGRNRVMSIEDPMSLTQLVQHTWGVSQGRVKWVAHPHSQGKCHAWDQVTRPSPNPELGIVIAIGSEGGFDDEEVGLFAGEGWSFLGLGPRVLRVESAVASAACAANWLFEPPVLYLPDT